MRCPADLALCGHPCGCEGKNPSHRAAARTLRGRPNDIVLTDAAFDDLLLRIDDPPQVNAKMVELLRRTRGTVEHR